MNRRSLLLWSLGLIVLAGVTSAQNSEIQAIIGNVFLQDSTPGTVQSGHASIGGTFRAGQVNVSQSTATTVPVIGNNTAVGAGTAVGGSFTSSQQSGIGVRGTAVATSGRTSGVYGESRSPGGAGVTGRNLTDTTGYTDFSAGVLGESTSAGIPGVYGYSTSGTGVYAKTATGDNALTAWNQSNSGMGIYVVGSTAIWSAGGTYGIYAQGGTGGSFHTSLPSGTALRGTNSKVGGSGYGIYGRHYASGGYAVFAEGKTGATGTKSFVIDHPSDPTNKTLSHYCTEGEEPLNVYRGKTVTDARGEAWVTLPDYFEEINTDPTVQLTVSDTSADFVVAKVAREVKDGKFQLRTSKPGTKVFWRVEARRNDRWVRTYGAPVEAMKPDYVRGTYMRPELYGKSQKLSEDSRRFPEPSQPSLPTQQP